MSLELRGEVWPKDVSLGGLEHSYIHIASWALPSTTLCPSVMALSLCDPETDSSQNKTKQVTAAMKLKDACTLEQK